MTRLMPDAPTPALAVETLAGHWSLAGRSPATFTMVVFYRGLHCPICKGFLTEIERLLPEFEAVGTEVIAVSMDPRDRAEQSAADWGLARLTLGYGLTEAQARDWNLYLTDSIKPAETPVFCEPGLFLVRPDGRLYLLNISNMPFARPDIASLPPKIAMATQNGYPARGTRA
jgi:peroxiredoxin